METQIDRNEVVAHFDNLGYLRCVACHTAREKVSAVKVYADNGAIVNETCDSCNLFIRSIRRRS